MIPNLHTRFAAAATALMLLLTGCVNDDSDCPSGGSDAKALGLHFVVVTRNSDALSRADEDCEEGPQGSAAENFINTSDCQFLLFDADGKLLRPLFPEISVEDNTTYTSYSITTLINEPYFDNAVKNGDADVTFYIMVIANAHSQGITSQYLTYNPGTTTADNIFAQLATFTQPMLPDAAWSPVIASKQFMPMAGMQKFTVTTAALKKSTYEDPVDLSPEGGNSDINMLRAVAKIEVIDKINAARDTRISGAALNGFFTTGTVLPSADQWPGYVTADVTLPTLPADAVYDTDTPLLFVKDDYALSLRTDGAHSVYSAYITEYSYETANQQEPMVTVSLQPDDKDKMPYKRPFYLAKYNQGSQYADPVTELLRNHIYRYEVTDLSVDNTLELLYTVCPMSNVSSDEISFN